MRRNTQRLTAGIAGLSAFALAIAGCSGDSDKDETSKGADAGEKITITLAVWDDWGLDDEIAQYEVDHPNVDIEVIETDGAGTSRDNLFTKLAAGSGLSDVEAIEVGWLPAIMEYADAFHDLAGPETSDRFLPWKSEAATTPDGRLIGLGTDIGPEAICFRSDLFEAAGLPSDREEVAELLGGENSTWDKYFEVGKEFVAKSDAAWFDAATQQFQIMAQQLANPYETDDNQVIATTNPEIKAIYDQVLQASVTDDLSAHIMQWNDDWTAGFQAGDWATMACPSWMLGTIEGNAAGVTGWDVANVFPNGGGNLGGSYVAVPTQTAHPEEAIEFATWLTAPEQQVALFFTDRTWPSATQSQSDPRLLEYTSEFFNDAPVGEIMSARALAINGLAHMGPLFSAINELAITAIARVDVDKTDDPASSWAKFETEVAALAGS